MEVKYAGIRNNYIFHAKNMIQYVSRMTDKKKRTLIMGFECDQKNTREKGMAVLMECKEIQQKYIPFIDDKLSKRELDAFLHHMEECPDCKEEYDIYYTMIMGMRYLKEDNRKSSDWVSSDEKLRYAQEYLRHFRIMRVQKLLLLVILCIAVILLIQ